MPTPKQMEQLTAEVVRRPAAPAAAPDAPFPDAYWNSVRKDPRAQADGTQIRKRWLVEIQRHLLRISCRRCERTVEIQTLDAIRLYGGNAVWKDVAQRLLDNTCQQRTGRHEEDGCWPAFETPKPAPDCRSDLLRLGVWMAPKYHPTPLSGGDRRALTKELGKARAMANILASQSAEMRAKGEAMIQQADIQLNERVSLRRANEILSWPQWCWIGRRDPDDHAFLAIRGRRIVQCGGPAQCERDQDRKALAMRKPMPDITTVAAMAPAIKDLLRDRPQ